MRLEFVKLVFDLLELLPSQEVLELFWVASQDLSVLAHLGRRLQDPPFSAVGQHNFLCVAEGDVQLTRNLG